MMNVSRIVLVKVHLKQYELKRFGNVWFALVEDL